MNKKRIELSIQAIIIITILVIIASLILIFQININLINLEINSIKETISILLKQYEVLQYLIIGIIVSYIVLISQVYSNKGTQIESIENEILNLINRMLIFILPLVCIIFLNNQEFILRLIFDAFADFVLNLTNIQISYYTNIFLTLIIILYIYKIFEIKKEKSWKWLIIGGIFFISPNIINTIEILIIIIIWNVMTTILDQLKDIDNKQNILKIDFEKLILEMLFFIPVKNISTIKKNINVLFNTLEDLLGKNDIYEISTILITLTLIVECIILNTTIILPLYLLIILPMWIRILRSIPSNKKVKIYLINGEIKEGTIIKRSIKQNYVIIKNKNKNEKIYLSAIVSEDEKN